MVTDLLVDLAIPVGPLLLDGNRDRRLAAAESRIAIRAGATAAKILSGGVRARRHSANLSVKSTGAATEKERQVGGDAVHVDGHETCDGARWQAAP